MTLQSYIVSDCTGKKMVLLRQQNWGQQITFLLLQPKILPQQSNVLLIEPNILLLQQNIFVIPILTNDFVGITKPFSCTKLGAFKPVPPSDAVRQQKKMF